MQIPTSDILTTNRLGKIFSNTVATYKFFWFVSIMQIHAKSDNPRISVWDIVIRMVANAWYPIHYFRLSFGKSDSLFDIVMDLQHITQIPIDANSQTIIEGLTSRLEDKQIKRLLTTLTLNVPYRFCVRGLILLMTRRWSDVPRHWRMEVYMLCTRRTRISTSFSIILGTLICIHITIF